jgi:hypothetical protein
VSNFDEKMAGKPHDKIPFARDIKNRQLGT